MSTTDNKDVGANTEIAIWANDFYKKGGFHGVIHAFKYAQWRDDSRRSSPEVAANIVSDKNDFKLKNWSLFAGRISPQYCLIHKIDATAETRDNLLEKWKKERMAFYDKIVLEENVKSLRAKLVHYGQHLQETGHWDLIESFGMPESEDEDSWPTKLADIKKEVETGVVRFEKSEIKLEALKSEEKALGEMVEKLEQMDNRARVQFG